MSRNSRIFGALIISALLCVPVFSADWATSEGSCYNQGSMIIGLGGSLLPFGAFASFDYGVHSAISAGGAIGFNTYGYSSTWRYSQVPILVRGAFHPFNLPVLSDKIKVRDILDPYVGLAMGWGIGFWSYEGTGVSGGEPDRLGLILREYIGVRYYFNPAFGIFAEDCAGLGALNAGVCFKF